LPVLICFPPPVPGGPGLSGSRICFISCHFRFYKSFFFSVGSWNRVFFILSEAVSVFPGRWGFFLFWPHGMVFFFFPPGGVAAPATSTGLFQILSTFAHRFPFQTGSAFFSSCLRPPPCRNMKTGWRSPLRRLLFFCPLSGSHPPGKFSFVAFPVFRYRGDLFFFFLTHILSPVFCSFLRNRRLFSLDNLLQPFWRGHEFLARPRTSPFIWPGL